MPNKCSAPGCRSNYDGEPHTPIFKIPNGPPHIVYQWKRFLHREFIEEIKKIYVCLKHFRDEDKERKKEWMRANRRQSLAELCNPKLVRLAQVPHRTADREDPKLARRKWQPPHNMGEPQTETH